MTEKEFWKFLNNNLAKGRVPQVSGRLDQKDQSMQAAGNFMSGHSLLPNDYDKIPKNTIKQMGELLFVEDVQLKTKETILVILAHHGSNEALNILKRYNKNPDQELKFFAEIALDECFMWNE